MRLHRSVMTLVSSLMVVLIMVIGINFGTTSHLTAQQEGRFDPLDERQELKDEKFDEQELDDEKMDDEFDDEDMDEDFDDQEFDDEDMRDEFDDEDMDDFDDEDFNEDFDDEDMDDFDDERFGDQEFDDDDFQEEDEFEGDEDWDEEGDEPEFEEQEFERMVLESNIAHLEVINRMAEIAQDDLATASYAIMQMEELFEDEQEAIGFLKEMLDSDRVSRPVKNLLKMKLAEIYSWSDQRDAALSVFKSMLMSDD